MCEVQVLRPPPGLPPILKTEPWLSSLRSECRVFQRRFYLTPTTRGVEGGTIIERGRTQNYTPVTHCERTSLPPPLAHLFGFPNRSPFGVHLCPGVKGRIDSNGTLRVTMPHYEVKPVLVGAKAELSQGDVIGANTMQWVLSELSAPVTTKQALLSTHCSYP